MPKAGARRAVLLPPVVHNEGATSEQAPRRATAPAALLVVLNVLLLRRDDDDDDDADAWAGWREKASSLVALSSRVASILAMLLAAPIVLVVYCFRVGFVICAGACVCACVRLCGLVVVLSV